MTRLLLDSHALIWFLAAEESLSARALSALSAADSELLVSAATIYELEWKRGSQADALPPLPKALLDEGFVILPIDARHAALAARLPGAGRDPWDRLIAAQAITEGVAVVTRDPALAELGAEVFW
ncbi:MAG: type II toxin-antitoxin system VapC family toxin [Thalassobaculales bacterium]